MWITISISYDPAECIVFLAITSLQFLRGYIMTTKNLFIIPLQVHANQDNLKAALAFKKHWIMRQKSYTIQALRFGFGQKYPAMLFFKLFPKALADKYNLQIPF